VFRTQKYRLYPTAEQADLLLKFVQATRCVYNLALEQRRDFRRQYQRATGRSLNYVTQGRQVTELRREFDWLREAPVGALHGALRDLDKAFVAFFRGGGYPAFRKAGINDSFEIKGIDTGTRPLNAKWSQAKLPKIGWVKYRDTRPIDGEIRSTRIVLEGSKWFACIGVRSDHEAPASKLPAVGIDRGVTLALALSDGTAVTAPAELAALDRRCRKAQRALSRRKRGSARYKAQRGTVAAIKSRAARVRRDWQHKTTTGICREFGTVVIEALNTRRMTVRGTGKRGLNRSILNIGWRGIETMLAYKLEQRGGTLVKINPAYTSQTCSACGTIDKASRESQASFACRHCGHDMNADHNAAINILRQGLAGADGSGCAPVEARTIHPRLAA
jgi:putative transposase